MTIHFEQLWEQCEKLHQETNLKETVSDTLIELSMKINLYKALDQKTEMPPEEWAKMKSRAMGEILLTMTKLSLQDNINVFEALNVAMQYRSIEHFANKHPV